MGALKDMIIKWLGIIPAKNEITIRVNEETNHWADTLGNEIWYRGDPSELDQYYKDVVAYTTYSTAKKSMFWASVSHDILIRKVHSGMPRLVVDKLTGIVVDSMNDPTFGEDDKDTASKERWNNIINLNFEETLKESIQKTLSLGDGAYKISIDPEISKTEPIIEFYGGNDVSYIIKRGIIREVTFYTQYEHKNKQYILCEHYGYGYVRYELTDTYHKKYFDLTTVPELADLEDITFSEETMLAVPLKFYSSAKYKGRGASIFEGKYDAYDGLDEVLSTWVDNIRANRVKQYIPEALVPRNSDDGSLMKPTIFNSYYIKGQSLAEDSNNEIETIQGDISYEGLVSSYLNFLDNALQGIISPSTLGIDVKKLDNAESQREKEKTTLYTRDTIIGKLQEVLPKLVDTALKTQDIMNNKSLNTYEASFTWGEYANPSFEAKVDTVGKAKTMGIMSTEQCVEELYGDSMKDEDKEAEVQRIKDEESQASGVIEFPMDDKAIEE